MRTFSVPVSLLACVVLGVALVAQQGPGTAPPPAPAGGPGGPGGRQGGRGGRGVQIQPGEECPPGTTEARPRTCQAPGFPPPSIVDYRPRSILVTDAHPVPKAKFPVIDFHGHPPGLLNSSDGLLSLASSLDALNVRLIVSADNMSGDRLRRTLGVIQGTPQKDRVRVLAGIDFRNVARAGPRRPSPSSRPT